MMQCVANGHEISAIANLKPPSQSGKGNILAGKIAVIFLVRIIDTTP